jgi:hypothetical protein
LACTVKRPIADPKYVFMSTQNIGFVGDPPDPKGKWTVDVSLVDKLGGTRLDLRSSFDLK